MNSPDDMGQHYRFSSFREKLIEHLFIGELLKASWLRGEYSLEVAKPEVDSRGYDVIIERNGIVRHIQLKTSHRGAVASSQKIHLGLAEKPSGCVLWIQFDNDTLDLGPYLFFGGPAGTPLPDISGFKVGKHTKANASGLKAERPDIRRVPKTLFRKLHTLAEVFDVLFDRPMDGQQIGKAVLQELQQGFHALIHQRLDEFRLKPALSLPLLPSPLPPADQALWFPIPGMFGGFSYWGEGEGSDIRLMVESWSRVEGGSGQRHEVTLDAVRLIDEGFV